MSSSIEMEGAYEPRDDEAAGPRTMAVTCASDIIRARQAGCALAAALGFDEESQASIATAIAEMTRNLLRYSGTTGKIDMSAFERGSSKGLQIIVSDKGHGIRDLASALQLFDPAPVIRLGAGLPGTKRLMDELLVDTGEGHGTIVRMTKWLSTDTHPAASEI
jgi:serine/threonine-protein kinase RsbT